MSRRLLLIMTGFTLITTLALVVVLLNLRYQSREVVGVSLEGLSVKMYKTPECGCCLEYAKYLEDLGAMVSIENRSWDELEAIKRGLGIPSHLWSCHTLVVKKLGYFVEGHVPGEAIAKLVSEKPAIKGIALPGMPPGSPGMLGAKSSPLTVYAVNLDNTTTIFSVH